jgi:hypothetical protein
MFELFSSKKKANPDTVSNDIPKDTVVPKDNITDAASRNSDLPANNSLLSSSESSTSNIMENHESSFIPPKNLPELAKDLYKEQYEQGQGIAKNSVSSESISKINSQKNFSTPSSIPSIPLIPSRSLRIVPEPSFSAVPKLDSGTLGLLKNNASIQRQDYAALNQLSTPNVSPAVGQLYPPQSYPHQSFPQQSFGQNFVSSQNIDEQKMRNIIQGIISEEMRIFINALNNSGRFNNFTSSASSSSASSSSASSSASTQSNIFTPRNVSTESAYSHDNSLSYNHDSDFGSKLNRLADLERLLSISKERYDVARNVHLQIEYDLRCKREEVRLLLAKDNHDKGHAKPLDSSADKPMHPVIQGNISSNASIITDVSANISPDKSGDMFQLLSKTATHDSNTMNDKVFFDETINKRNDDLATIPHVLPEVLSSDIHSDRNPNISSGVHTDYPLNVSSASPIGVIRDEDFISELQLLREVNISDPAKYFYFSGGRILRSINDMIYLLAEISDEDFFIHANSSKNDFASWIEDVFGYSIVANRIRNVLDRRNLLDLLSLH